MISAEGLSRAREGGSEHDVWFDDSSGRWVKFTKPNRAGFTVEVIGETLKMLPASPLQYLERWRLCNRLFFDDVWFCGVAGDASGRRIVVSQRDLSGESPTWEEIDDFFTGIFEMVEIKADTCLGGYSSKSYGSGRTGVFDVRPANCVRTNAGVVLPFDVIPQRFNAEEARVVVAHYQPF